MRKKTHENKAPMHLRYPVGGVLGIVRILESNCDMNLLVLVVKQRMLRKVLRAFIPLLE